MNVFKIIINIIYIYRESVNMREINPSGFFRYLPKSSYNKLIGRVVRGGWVLRQMLISNSYFSQNMGCQTDDYLFSLYQFSLTCLGRETSLKDLQES